MNILFISSFAIVTPDPQLSRRLYVDALGLPLKSAEGDEYLHSEEIAGSKHFGLWPLGQTLGVHVRQRLDRDHRVDARCRREGGTVEDEQVAHVPRLAVGLASRHPGRAAEPGRPHDVERDRLRLTRAPAARVRGPHE